MKLSYRVFITIFALIALISTTAMASSNPTPRGTSPPLTARQIFDFIDTSRDGMITKDEATKYLLSLGAPRKEIPEIVSDIWKGEDSNKDGVISWEEWNLVNGPTIDEANRRPNPNNNAAASPVNTMETLSLTNNHFTQVLANFIGGANNNISTDEEHDSTVVAEDEDEEDDGSFLVQMTDKLFCPSQDIEDEDCIFLAFPSTNCVKNEEICYIVCKSDEKTDEEICYQIAFEEEDSE